MQGLDLYSSSAHNVAAAVALLFFLFFHRSNYRYLRVQLYYIPLYISLEGPNYWVHGPSTVIVRG